MLTWSVLVRAGLIVFCVGLDASMAAGGGGGDAPAAAETRQARSRLYCALTRAHMMAVRAQRPLRVRCFAKTDSGHLSCRLPRQAQACCFSAAAFGFRMCVTFALCWVVLLRQVVINELEPDGWLTWLQNVKLDEQQARDIHTHTPNRSSNSAM